MPPSGYQVRVGVFFAASGAEQVVDEPGDSLAARLADLRDHRSLRRISSAAASKPFRPTQARRRVREQVPGTLPGGVQLRYRLVQVHPDPPHQPGRAENSPRASRNGL